MVSLIEDSSTINGWFLLDNYRPDDNQTALLKNQSVYDQMAHIQGDLGNTSNNYKQIINHTETIAIQLYKSM